MVEMNEWGCGLYSGTGNLLTFVSFWDKNTGVQVICGVGYSLENTVLIHPCWYLSCCSLFFAHLLKPVATRSNQQLFVRWWTGWHLKLFIIGGYGRRNRVCLFLIKYWSTIECWHFFLPLFCTFLFFFFPVFDIIRCSIIFHSSQWFIISKPNINEKND